ncbi:hypothetical protein [Archangium sp. Cb G35]|uniref:hypothetical protein n=1 Tax=Archangium sp. Cb G35 TaxID=1920190 RepID=UPI001160F064|nr:hypothetical protein [Archangium sp. Cb G35]
MATYRREIVSNESGLIRKFSAALRRLPAPLPETKPRLNKSLQGNLAETLVYELGDEYWALFKKRWTWVANATTPWKKSSDPGFDILAIRPGPPLTLLVIEVKSSSISGTKLIASKKSSLKADFSGLFSRNARGRLTIRIGAILSDLELKMSRPDMVEPVKRLVGTKPSTSPKIQLIGVLVCCTGSNTSHIARRERAFTRLQHWLIKKGWQPTQVRLNSIELNDLNDFLKKTIQKTFQ